MNHKDYSLFNYSHAIPTILQYQVISKLILSIIMILYRQITGFLLWNMGRPAFTSGDLPYIMRSWQGWVLILSGFLVLVIYTIFDINATLLISNRIIHGEEVKALEIVKEAFRKAALFKRPLGILIVLYVSLIAPLTGASFGITLTSSLAIPDFIMSFIKANFILKWLYNALIIALFFVGFLHMFTFHFVLLEDMDVKEALRNSRTIMKKNWKDFLKHYVIFIVKALVILALLFLFVFVLPDLLIHLLHPSEVIYHTAIVFISFITIIAVLLFGLLFLYFLMMKLTLLYERYTGFTPSYADENAATKIRRMFPRWFKAIIAIVLIVIIIVSIGGGLTFDEVFPKNSSVQVIAHRAGGDLAHENTILGLRAAKEYHADYSEIDVQRTKDGYYIINHDDTFERVCDDPRTPGEMTLAEIKQLNVKYALNPLTPPTEVATIEEFLDTAKEIHMPLLIELKGVSADHQMADDVYRMVVERDMIDDVMFIGLKYDLLDYVEKTYPEITTAYLCYFGFGAIENMNVDVLLLEAETATDSNILKVHTADKKVGVWTVDDLTAMTFTMLSDADYIITDKVEEAEDMKNYIREMPDEARVLDVMLPR